MIRRIVALFIALAIGIGSVQAQEITYSPDELPTNGVMILGQYGDFTLVYVATDEVGGLHFLGLGGQGPGITFAISTLEAISITPIVSNVGNTISAFAIDIQRKTDATKDVNLGDFNFSLDSLKQLGSIADQVAHNIAGVLQTQDIHCTVAIQSGGMAPAFSSLSFSCTTVV